MLALSIRAGIALGLVWKTLNRDNTLKMACRRWKRRRAFGLRPVPTTLSRPFGFNPSRLRACSAARSACGNPEPSADVLRRVGLIQ
ncbi:hypothetical protein FA202_04730 [Pseudomonas aeruginosa]|nr:hypothetical protein [Pseudomonas aeruginosa]